MSVNIQLPGLVTVEHKTIKKVPLPVINRPFNAFYFFVDAVCWLSFPPHGPLFFSLTSPLIAFFSICQQANWIHNPKCIKGGWKQTTGPKQISALAAEWQTAFILLFSV